MLEKSQKTNKFIEKLHDRVEIMHGRRKQMIDSPGEIMQKSA